MPIDNYGVVKGRLVTHVLDHGHFRPHYHLLVQADADWLHIAINVRSAIDRAELLCHIDDRLDHPDTEFWHSLPPGFTPLPPTPESGAVDYIRSQIVDRRSFRIAHQGRRGEGGLPDLLDVYANRAIANPNVVAYGFGARWGPKPHEIDRTFPRHPIQPSDGVHNVHMNQGSELEAGPRDGKHRDENGPWQDGALMFHDLDRGEWTGIFLAFQSQHWHTDNQTGHAVLDRAQIGAWHSPGGDEPDFQVRIVAAMVNPIGPAPEAETVTLLNTTAAPVDLAGWSLVNSSRRSTLLTGVIPAGDTLVVDVSRDASLSNRGGTIGLLDAQGLQVDGVSYSWRRAAREGELITF
jgi:uncharacterized protein YukJ